eukprot:jgi/Bigna1/133145/aug1.20_g7853
MRCRVDLIENRVYSETLEDNLKARKMGVESSKSKLGDIPDIDHLDEDLVAVNSLSAHELTDIAEAKTFKPLGLPKFSISVPDDIGKVLEGRSIIDQKSLHHTVADISQLKTQAYSTLEFVNSLQFKQHQMKRIHLALRRETERVEKRRESKEKAIKSALRQKVPLLSMGARMGIQTCAELFVQNVQILHMTGIAGSDYLPRTLRTLDRLLKMMTPLSICDSQAFSPDVAVGLEPVLQMLRDMADVSNPEYKGAFVNRGVDAMCHFALARGTVSDVLAVVEVLYDNNRAELLGTTVKMIGDKKRNQQNADGTAAPSSSSSSPPPPREYPIGGFFRYIMNFEPQDQGISLKAYEQKVVTFKTLEDKYLSCRGRQVSLRSDCHAYEKFYAEVLGDRIAFRTHDRRYLSAGDGQIVLTESPGSAEKFRLVPAPRNSKYPNHVGVQTNYKTFFTYLRGQGIVTHAKRYSDNCLFDIETSDVVLGSEADEKDAAAAAAHSLKPFPESSDELMARYEKDYLDIRADSKVSGPLSAVLVMAKLEALALTEAPADDDKEQLPVICKPLCVTVSRRTIVHLSHIIERTSTSYFDSKHAALVCRSINEYVNEMYMLLAALRILKVHLYQTVRSRLSTAELDVQPAEVERLRDLVYGLLKKPPAAFKLPSAADSDENTTTEDERAAMEAAQRDVLTRLKRAVRHQVMTTASEVFAAGFEFFYPNGSDQVGYLADLLDRKTEKRHLQSARSGRELWASALQKLGASDGLLRCLAPEDDGRDFKTANRDSDVGARSSENENLTVSHAEDKLLQLLLSRFASFGAGSQLMDELEGKGVVDKKKSFLSVNKVFTLLLNVCSEEAFNLLEDINNQLQLTNSGRGTNGLDLTDDKLFTKSRGALAILENLQKQLLGRAGLFVRPSKKERETQRTDGVTNSTVGFSGGGSRKAHHLALQTLVGYAEGLIHHASKILNRALAISEATFNCEALGIMGIALLEHTFIGRLAHSLLAALPMFAMPEHQLLALRLLPELSQLTAALDGLAGVLSRMPGAHSLMPIPKRLTFESRHPYRGGIDRKFRVRVKGAKQLRIEFDKRCATLAKHDSLQMIDKAQNPVHQAMHGPAAGRDSKNNSEWPKEEIAVKGDTVFVTFKTQKASKGDFANTELGFGYRFTVIGSAMEKPMGWLTEFNQTALHCSGLLLATAIGGSLPSVREVHYRARLREPCIQGGLLKTHPRYNELSADLSTMIVSPSDRNYIDGLIAGGAVIPAAHTKLLEDLETGNANGKKMMKALYKAGDRVTLGRGKEQELAELLSMRYFALVLRHTAQTGEALSFLNKKVTPTPPKLRAAYEQALRVKMSARSWYKDGTNRASKFAKLVEYQNFFETRFAFMRHVAPHPLLTQAQADDGEDMKVQEAKEEKGHGESEVSFENSLEAKIMESLSCFFRHGKGALSEKVIDDLAIAMITQRERAVARLIGIKYWTEFLKMQEPMALELICKPAASAFVIESVKGPLKKQHLLDGIECAGGSINTEIFECYYNEVLRRLFLVEKGAQQLEPERQSRPLMIRKGRGIARLADLVVQMRMAEERRIGYGIRAMLIDLCANQTYKLTPSDLNGLVRAGVVSFIGQALHEILLGFAGTDSSLQSILMHYSTTESEEEGEGGDSASSGVRTRASVFACCFCCFLVVVMDD